MTLYHLTHDILTTTGLDNECGRDGNSRLTGVEDAVSICVRGVVVRIIFSAFSLISSNNAWWR